MVCSYYDTIHQEVIIGILKIRNDHILRLQIIKNKVAITVDHRILQIVFKKARQSVITVEELQISSQFI